MLICRIDFDRHRRVSVEISLTAKISADNVPEPSISLSLDLWQYVIGSVGCALPVDMRRGHGKGLLCARAHTRSPIIVARVPVKMIRNVEPIVPLAVPYYWNSRAGKSLCLTT